MLKTSKKIGLIVIIAVLIGAVWLYKKRFTSLEKPITVQSIAAKQATLPLPSPYLLNEFTPFDREFGTFFQRNTLFFDRLFPKINHYTLSSSLREAPKQFILSMNVPGINPKDITISIQNRLISVSVTKKSIAYVYYSFSLPDTASSDKITAKASRGVLEIIIPKTAKAPSKKIIVQER